MSFPHTLLEELQFPSDITTAILLTLVAVLLAGLLFFLARVVSFFSGSRKSGDRQRRR